jgi:hypothetical protein
MLPTTHYLHAAAKAVDPDRSRGCLWRILVRVHGGGAQSIMATDGRILVRYTATDASGQFFAVPPDTIGAWQLDPKHLPRVSAQGRTIPRIDGIALRFDDGATVVMAPDELRPYPPSADAALDRGTVPESVEPAVSFDASYLARLPHLLYPQGSRAGAPCTIVASGRGYRVATAMPECDMVQREVLIMPMHVDQDAARQRFPRLAFAHHEKASA